MCNKKRNILLLCTLNGLRRWRINYLFLAKNEQSPSSAIALATGRGIPMSRQPFGIHSFAVGSVGPRYIRLVWALSAIPAG